MEGTFQEAIVLTLGNEGGWYDGSQLSDPNPTMYGVTQNTYDAFREKRGLPTQSVQYIEQAEVFNIYSDYWTGTCDAVAKTHPLTALCLFDMAINAGVLTARRLLQLAVDLEADGHVGELDADGKLGPKTLAAVAACTHDELLCLWLLMERVRYYDGLMTAEKMRPNLKPWIDRTVKFYNKYIREG